MFARHSFDASCDFITQTQKVCCVAYTVVLLVWCKAMDVDSMEAGTSKAGPEQTRRSRRAPRSGGDTKIGPSLANVSDTISSCKLKLVIHN